MCGIAGVYQAEGILPKRDVLKNMVDLLAHRGPDESGYFWGDRLQLGVRRLAVLDAEGGRQPVVDHMEGLAVVHSGEIYNYKELRDDLVRCGHGFNTQSDAEVVLHGYREWGEACVDRFRGMFAFAVWDGENESLFLARDRLGIKPLYFVEIPGGLFLFASEIKALLSYPGIRKEMYPPALHNLFNYGFNTAPYTFFQGIMQLLPGHFMRVSPQGISTKKYWDIHLDRPVLQMDETEICRSLRSRIEQAVRDALAADVPVGAYLSGGVDSSTITGMYARLSNDPVASLSIILEGADYREVQYSREASGFFHTRNIEFPCRISAEEVPQMIYHMEEPMATLLALPLFQLSRAAREAGFKAMLSGDGADEIFGGYNYFKILKMMDFISRTRGPCRKIILGRIFPQIKNPVQAGLFHCMLLQTGHGSPHPAMPYRFYGLFPRPGLFSREYMDRLAELQVDTPWFLFSSHMDERPLLDQALYIETKMRLLNLTLPLADKMGMAHSIELRPPFLDHNLVEFAFRIPAHLKMKGLNEKYILKKSVQGFLPASICARTKQPLQPAGREFIHEIFPLMQEQLSEETIRKKGYFDAGFLKNALLEHETNPQVDHTGLLLTAFFVHLWDEVFLK